MGMPTTELIRMDEKTPQLIVLSDDPSLNGALVYFVPEGKPTTLGSGSSCQIPLSGPGIGFQILKFSVLKC